MPDFVPLLIIEVRRETRDAMSLALAVPVEHREAFRYRPGQHLAVRARLDGEEVRRTYSICSGPDDPHLRIAIKRLPEGRFSTWATTQLRPGMTLDVMRPAGRFVLPDGDGEPRHLLGVAAGAGITPVMAMLQHALAREPQTRFTLVYGNRTTEAALFLEAIEELKDLHMGRLSLIHVLSGEDSDTPLLAGRITPDKLREIVAWLLPANEIAHAFLCGPGGMIRDLRQALFELGLARDRVHHEFFAPPGGATPLPAERRPQVPTASVGAGSAEVVAILDGVRHRLDMRPGEAVLDAAIRAGLRVPYSCKAGMCCTCRARIVEGQATMQANYSLEPWEIERGFTLTCQAIPLQARLVIDYDQM
ncbi:MAG: 2Fe-2S iron-sulfur cluster-binding protein [Hyphomicrobiaceae bacterium]